MHVGRLVLCAAAATWMGLESWESVGGALPVGGAARPILQCHAWHCGSFWPASSCRLTRQLGASGQCVGAVGWSTRVSE